MTSRPRDQQGDLRGFAAVSRGFLPVDHVEGRLTRVLGGWAAASVLAGAATYPLSRGFGRQTAAWGAVDGAIAYVGSRRRGRTSPERLRRVLLVNAGLDVGYLAAGAWLVRDGRWREDGVAVLVQGGFLLVLDSWAALALGRGEC